MSRSARVIGRDLVLYVTTTRSLLHYGHRVGQLDGLVAIESGAAVDLDRLGSERLKSHSSLVHELDEDEGTGSRPPSIVGRDLGTCFGQDCFGVVEIVAAATECADPYESRLTALDGVRNLDAATSPVDL